jgi:hypothetical protein
LKKIYLSFLMFSVLFVGFSCSYSDSTTDVEEDKNRNPSAKEKNVELDIEESVVKFKIEDSAVIVLHNISQKRAEVIYQRLENIIQQDSSFKVQDTRINKMPVVILNDLPIITVTPEQLENREISSQGLAYSWAKNIQEVLSAEFENPDCPYELMAIRSIRGEFGDLEKWQERGYTKLLDEGGVKKTAWVTQYYPSEGFPRGQGTRWGVGVDERVIAANELPASSWVILLNVGIRQVLDTGANSNDSVARRKGADHWLDLWVPKSNMYGFSTMTTEAMAIEPDGSYRWKLGPAPKYRWF